MKSIISFLKSNVQVSITIAAIALLALSNTYFVVQAQEDQKTTEGETTQEQPTQEQPVQPVVPALDLAANPPLPPSSYPHIGCVQKLIYTTPVSNTFNPNMPYNLSFFRGSPTTQFQDINGDSLPDYLWVNNTVNGGTTLVQNYEACVYLNNGSGWTKAYECYAITETTAGTGNITRAEYYGDCAGTPLSGQSN